MYFKKKHAEESPNYNRFKIYGSCLLLALQFLVSYRNKKKISAYFKDAFIYIHSYEKF